ncbi:MAG: S8 family serine peptidase, partial [Planctomycetota bacterium]
LAPGGVLGTIDDDARLSPRAQQDVEQSDMTIRRRSLALVALAGASSAAAAQPLAASNTQPTTQSPATSRTLDANAEVLQVCTHAGSARFRLADPSALVCDAERIAPDGLSEASYRAHARVLLRRGDLQAARLAPSVTLRDVPGATGWVAAETPSVAHAVELAHTLNHTRGVAAHVEIGQPMRLRGGLPTDERLVDQWHLINNDPGREQVDLEAEGAWMLGATGAGVTVGVVEVGFWQSHSDLAPNYHAEASQSFDINTPHGTSVAGLIAADANDNGSVGIAYDARVSQQEIDLNGSPIVSAAAYAFRNDLNDVKNHSYGPPDNRRIHVMDPIEHASMRDAMVNGRGGLGTVFVWAAGNGGVSGDRVDYDPYASSRYTIAINGFTDLDEPAHWTERGAAVFAATPSSGLNDVNRGQTTTTYTNPGGVRTSSWTDGFGFSSGAAPLGAGVVALMLQARPDLTWRDVQHALANSVRDLASQDAGWQTNAAGRRHHERLGFGAVNARAAVEAALDHALVGPEVSVQTPLLSINTPLPDAFTDPDTEELTTTTIVREFDVDLDIEVEHVEIVLTLDSDAQGDIAITVVSPSGTVSTLTEARFADFLDNVKAHTFTSVRQWGERSAGTWTIMMTDELTGMETDWVDARLRFHGTCHPADTTSFNGQEATPDGQVTLSDFSVFLARWSQGDPAADITSPDLPSHQLSDGCATGFGPNRPAGDGVTIDDFTCYLNRWIAGCPASNIEFDAD